MEAPGGNAEFRMPGAELKAISFGIWHATFGIHY
jgi:hypothetical protein